jgi:hypothetical protein
LKKVGIISAPFYLQNQNGRRKMPIGKLYHVLRRRLKEQLPKERITRIRNMTYLLIGLLESRSVHLSKIAGKIPGQAFLPSTTRRLSRFLDNPAVRVREWYKPVAKAIIDRIAHVEIRLIIDGSKVGFGHQLLMVAIAYRRRAIPLAWTWVKGSRGHSTSHKQKSLLSYVHSLIPPDANVSVVGDAEFGDVEVQKLLKRWGWRYVLRQPGRYLVKKNGNSSFQRLDSLVSKSGQRVWLPKCALTAKHGYTVNLVAFWKPGEKEPWFLATNCDCLNSGLRAYKRRMWIEEMFGDFKGNGFDLESTHLRHFLRLSRLTLAVSLLYVWLLAFGSRVIKNGKRHLVDRSDRRDYSVFRIGRNMIERCLTNGYDIRIVFVPYL